MVVLALAAGLYGVSAAPGALWGDSGLAQLRALRGDYVGGLGLALAHPLFYLLAGLFQFLPFADPALKTNLASAACGAVTVANLYLFLRLLLPADRAGRFGAGVGAAGLALAHTFWWHASVAEVYTLSTCLLSFELLALAWFVRKGETTWFLAAWLINGLECSNHLLGLLTAAGLAGWSVWLVRRRRISRPALAAAGGLWLLGLAPYLYLGFDAWRDGMAPGAVVSSMLFGGEYRGAVLNVLPTGRMLLVSLGVIALNFPTPNLLLVPLGLAAGRARLDPNLRGLLIAVTVLHLVFAVRYPVPDQPTFFIIPVFFLAIWLAAGAAWLAERAPSLREAAVVFVLANPVLYHALAVWMEGRSGLLPDPVPYRNEARYFFEPWKTTCDGASRLALEVFRDLPAGAIVIADTTSERPLRYYQAGLGLRPDLNVVFEPCPNVSERLRPLELALRLRTRGERVFVVRPRPGYCPAYILDRFALAPAGSLYEVRMRPPPTPPTTAATASAPATPAAATATATHRADPGG